MKNLKQYLKQQIKEKSALQHDYKLQRKAVHYKGNRTMTRYQATEKHFENRIAIRIMLFVYGLERGKTVEQIEGSKSEGFNPTFIEKMKDKYESELLAIHPEIVDYV